VDEQDACGHAPFCPRLLALSPFFQLDGENKTGIRTKTEQRCGCPQTAHRGMRRMVRLARESLAFVSVASFVWMMCQVAGAVG
jgi:hypothetical protein